MKAAICLSILVAASDAAASAAFQRSNRATNEISADSICGELGVMRFNASELPDYVSPNNVRMWPSLPPAYTNKQSPASNATNSNVRHLNERSCYFEAPYGCSRGWCWKACDQGSGKWCWAAANSGYGSWKKCTTYADCGTDNSAFGCGRLCGVQCGCSC
ncbi:hypothetical protein M441DRAFT_192721 [Trichoderma asperellum CBS 433.97]|uniref:IDI-2 n=1 Tax=Trichoderma asperellum (strain ATCC 204424 / CBS 433.97 / NBRC 101777) TaxID=1042311 RepID=A0A2T3ZA88_TRIA4|nr:hypothetical protein M441DRAFT_192721 [Trichoderma asperellum CBS 433.97]PTB41692.1 hypothetical protein M441DRAFT_192721 [Trichoderma asperellum CBS 433.97]